MSNYIANVGIFNSEILNIKDRQPGLLTIGELEYAGKAIEEELAEFQEAHANQDMIGAVDAAIDLTYFAFGFLYRMGLTSDQIIACCAAVHEANMAKAASRNVSKRVSGEVDAEKPDGWVGPEEAIGAILSGV